MVAVVVSGGVVEARGGEWYSGSNRSCDEEKIGTCRKGVGYNDVPPPLTGLFAPPTIDLSNSGLEEFQRPEFKGYGPKASKSVCVDTSNEVKKTSDTLFVEKLVSEKKKQLFFLLK
ncbi:hypothetical protein Tco_1059306 [Tanacetum coccineum]